MALSDISADGDNKLIIADLGTGTYDMKLKVYKGRSPAGKPFYWHGLTEITYLHSVKCGIKVLSIHI